MLSREFFHQLEDEVNRARREINEKHMGQADLRARYRLAAAMEQLRGATEPKPENPSMSTPPPINFAASIRAMMDEARAGVAKARQDGIAIVGDAVGKLKEAEVATVKVAGSMAKMVEDEAATVMSELGQISNDLGAE